MAPLGRMSVLRGARAGARGLWQQFDVLLLALTALLVLFGIVMIRSSAAGSPSLEGLAARQAQYALAGAVVVALGPFVNYKTLLGLSGYFYVAAVLLLGAILAVGLTAFGAQRWFDFFGLFFVQPAELVKIGSVVWLASFFARRREQLLQFRWVCASLMYAGVPVVMVLLQPNLSTAAMLGFIWFGIAWAAGLRWTHLGILALMGAGSLPLLWLGLVPYQRARIANFLFPDAAGGARYNVEQALISIGSGGWLGQGYGQSSQVQLRFLKVRHTDFIFSASAAEFGFVGALILLALLALLVLRLLQIARQSDDAFGAYLCYGLATLFFVQTVLNVSVNLNLFPVAGLPLPFVSYGGSALLAAALGIAIALSVNAHRNPRKF